MLPLSVLIPIGLLGFIFLYLLWTYSYWYRKGVPQENPFKLFGGNNDFTLSRENYYTLYKTTYNKYKEYRFKGVYNLFGPAIFLCDPDLIKDVMLNKYRVFPDPAVEIHPDVDPIMTRDPFFQKGQQWKESRSRFSTLGTPHRLRGILPYTLEVCGPMNEYIRNLRHESGRGDGTDVKELASKFVTDTLVAVLLGGNANSFSTEQSTFQEIGKAVFEDNIIQNLAMLMIIGAPHLARILKLRIIPKKAGDVLTKIIKEQMIKRKRSGEVRQDIFDFLLKKYESDEKEVADTIITFYVEGFESTSVVAAFTLFNLARNPDIQEKLREQIREKAPPGTKLSEEAVSNLPLLTNCILETMRLHSPVTLLQRKATDDCTLQAPTGEELFLKKGSVVSIPIVGLHQDDTIFPNPEIFDPERFNDPEQPHYFMGFGDGPRLCLGQRFAQQSISVFVASNIRDFQIEISPKMSFPMKFSSHPFFLYPADGMWLRFVAL